MKFLQDELEKQIQAIRETGVQINEIAEKLGITRDELNYTRLSKVKSKRAELLKQIQEAYPDEIIITDENYQRKYTESLEEEVKRLRAQNEKLINELLKKLSD